MNILLSTVSGYGVVITGLLVFIGFGILVTCLKRQKKCIKCGNKMTEVPDYPYGEFDYHWECDHCKYIEDYFKGKYTLKP